MARKRAYTAPTNAIERIKEAQAAILRLRAGMQGDNRFGEYGRNCREAIARWQAVIDCETAAFPGFTTEQIIAGLTKPAI